MIRVLLPLLMTMVVCAESPQEKAVAPPALPTAAAETAAAKKDAPLVQEKATAEKAASDKPEPNKPNPEIAAPGTSTLEKNGDTPASRMQSSLEKQRASARRQASSWISVG